MKRKFFLSLNVKIFLILFFSFACVCSLFLSTFMISYVKQIDREATMARKKAESLYELYSENMKLRDELNTFYEREEKKGVDSFSKLWEKQGAFNYIEPLDQRQIAIRRELLNDMKGSSERNKKVELVGYFILFASLLVFLMLEILWLIVRRLILTPVEALLEATHHIANGELSYRVPEPLKNSKEDELALLAKGFNQMADNIEKSIQQTENNKTFLQNLINAIPESLRVFDEDYNLLLTNNSYNELSQKIIQTKTKKCYELCRFDAPCRQEQNPCPVSLLKGQKDKPITLIQRYMDSENRERFMEVSAVATTHQENGQQYVRYIELLRPLDKAILLSHQQKLSSVGMLASSVAHEMRNPLGSIRLILENVLERMDRKPMGQEDLKHYLSLINQQIKFCIDVTSRLLKLSRKPEETAQKVDLNEVISETVCLLEYEAKKTGIEMEIKESDRSALVLASDSEMRMLTVNLMQNAFHAMNAGGKMTVSVFEQGDKVCVDFADTGRGIEEKDINRIFEPFFSKNKEVTETQGTGLGLSIVKTIVENYGGVISVESVLGQGTTFHLSFDRLD